MVEQAGFAQFFDARIERIGSDAAHAVLQQTERLRVSVTQRPQHTHRITALESLEQLIDGGVVFGAHERFSLRMKESSP